MSWLPSWQAGFDADILLTGEDERKVVEVKGEKDRRETCPVYYDGESVKGQVSCARKVVSNEGERYWILRLDMVWVLNKQVVVRAKDAGKGLKHDGIKVEFVGSIGQLHATL